MAVEIAIAALYVGLFLSIGGMFFSTRALRHSPQLKIDDDALILTIIVVVVVVLGIQWLLIRKVAAGRNWARIITIMLTALGVPLSLVGLPAQFTRSSNEGYLALAQLACSITASVLLLTSSSKRWFKQVASVMKRP